MIKTSFLFLSLFFLLPQISNAALDFYNIEIQCAKEKPIDATIMIELESKNWSWQCTDLDAYTYKSDVRVNPGMVTIEMPDTVYEIDKAESDAKFNGGLMQSYYNEDVSCANLISEFDKSGISAFYQKNWPHGTGYNQHGFALKDSSGKTLTLYLNLANYYDSAFSLINGTIERDGFSSGCTISAIRK